MGIFPYNELKSARVIPVFVRDLSPVIHFGMVEFSMAIEAWITPSASSADVNWISHPGYPFDDSNNGRGGLDRLSACREMGTYQVAY